jgi:hypothetical protein
VGAQADRVEWLHGRFGGYRSGNAYDREAITHVIACAAHCPGLFLSAERRDRSVVGEDLTDMPPTSRPTSPADRRRRGRRRRRQR